MDTRARKQFSNRHGAVLGVSLNDGERVEWIYTVLPDGRRIVTGYDILPMIPVV